VAALLASHLAFIAAASCARRSGERFNFFFVLGAALCFAATGAFVPAVRVEAVRDLFAGAFLAGVAAFAGGACLRLPVVLPALTMAPSFIVSLASFLVSFDNRDFSRSIFLLRPFCFFISGRVTARRIATGGSISRVNDESPPMSRMFHVSEANNAAAALSTGSGAIDMRIGPQRQISRAPAVVS